MHYKLKTVFCNLEAFISTYNISKDNIEDKFEDNSVKNLIDLYYNSQIMPIVQENELVYTLSDLTNDLKNNFKPAVPTQAIAEHYTLDKWLNQAVRVYEEHRFNNYKKYLREKGNGSSVNQLESDTFKILDCCHDPRVLDREWDRRGLVYGHVQSGKTQNYLGLVNRAFDAGYKIIIILTGVTEDLRIQTQMRVDESVINLNKELYKQGRTNNIYSPTNINDDLSTSNYTNLIVNYNLVENSIWVIKKHKTVLENLIFWLDYHRREQKSIKVNNTSFLIIDDEGDNASISSMSKRDFEAWDSEITRENINQENNEGYEEKRNEFILKTINKYIRIILSLISNKTFISYTATPYSIINQSYEDIDRNEEIIQDINTNREVKFKIDAGDLFPEHFIIPIKPGYKYFGIEKIFNTKLDLNIPCLININESYSEENINSIFPTGRNDIYSFEKIPKSLYDAILYFLVSIVIKKFRNIKDHNTMLIHTSHLTSRTDYLADKVELSIKSIYNEIRRTDSKILKTINDVLNNLKNNGKNKLYNTYFELSGEYPETITASDITNIFEDCDQKLLVVSYHSSNDPSLKHIYRSLDYNLKDEFTGQILYRNYIVVGGNRLSRGLTFNGLTTSYFVRSSTRQDSLYQMGRWFGYRKGYEDLVRIFLPEDQIIWFQSIYKLESQLRRDFENNNDPESPILPRNAIIKLANFTDEIYLTDEQRRRFPSICDPNKLRKTVNQKMNFSGPIVVGKILFKEEEKLKNNFHIVRKQFDHLIEHYQSQLFDYSSLPKEWSQNTNISFTKIPAIEIIKFLKSYNFHPDLTAEMKSFIEFIDKNSDKINEWSISLVNRKNNKDFQGIEWDISKFYHQKNNIKSLRPVERNDYKEISETNTWVFQSIIERGAKDTSFDLIDENNVNDFKDKPEDKVKHIRDEKKKPLLLIYPVIFPNKNFLFPLLYIFYPRISDSKSVNFIVRKNYR
jgi:hypothetical protein